jgi:hypothetical protein
MLWQFREIEDVPAWGTDNLHGYLFIPPRLQLSRCFVKRLVFFFVKVKISNMYRDGKVRIFNFLNKGLHDSICPTSQMDLIHFFCRMKTRLMCVEFPHRISPYLSTEPTYPWYAVRAVLRLANFERRYKANTNLFIFWQV